MQSAEQMRLPQVSVIIPVYRDWPGLRRCLDALAAQTLPRGDFEIIVANNDDAPPPDDFLLAGAQLLMAPEGHSYAARNAALAVARGRVLAFTDADCRPEPDWLAEGLAALDEAAGAMLAAGRVRIAVQRRNLATDYEQATAFRQQDNVRAGHAVTANLMVRRSVFDAIGPFNSTMQSSGDFEFCSRAVAAGFQLIYAERAVVWHPARDSLSALLRKNRRVAGGFRRRHFELPGLGRRARWQFVMTMLKPRLRYWWRLLRGQEKTAELPALRRPGVVLVQMLLHYHFALSLLRAPPGKDAH